MQKNIYTFVVNYYGTNCYVYKDTRSSSAIVIDPGGDIEQVVETIKKNSLEIKYIVVTHSHFDHIASLEKIYELYPVPIIVHETEYENVVDNKKNLSLMFGVEGIKDYGKNLQWKKVKDGETFFCGMQEIKVIHTPGHTIGGICIYIDEGEKKYLFTGDTLFRGTVGRTDFDGGNFDILINSLKKLTKLPKETIILPGHEQPSILEIELITNEYLKNIV